MEKVVPWKALLELIEPHYPKTSSKGGRPPYPLSTMLRLPRRHAPRKAASAARHAGGTTG